MATAGQLVFRLSDLIDRLLADAKTPHLLPVRAGEINRARRQDFVRTHPEREERQILNFLNMDNGLLAFNDRSRKDSVYDNGASTQSLKFDDLRDGKGNRIALREALPVNDFIERCRTRCPADLPDRKPVYSHAPSERSGRKRIAEIDRLPRPGYSQAVSDSGRGRRWPCHRAERHGSAAVRGKIKNVRKQGGGKALPHASARRYNCNAGASVLT